MSSVPATGLATQEGRGAEMTATVPAQPATAVSGTAGEWQAVYAFYMGNPLPALTECVRPLLKELRASRLAAGCCIAHSWFKHHHTQIGLKQVAPAATTKDRARAKAPSGNF